MMPMHGPGILARSLSKHDYVDDYRNHWQYNPWSDHHSKVACWGAMFDLFLECNLLRKQIAEGAVAFGINHRMLDFKRNKPKDLDLVICKPGSGPKGQRTFVSMAQEYEIDLTEEQTRLLASLPELREAPVGAVHLALEAKATMTAHVKALPRLDDELTSSHNCIHGASKFAIAAGVSIINLAPDFVSPKNNPWKISSKKRRVNRHGQPNATVRTIDKVKTIARRTNVEESGFDALAIIVIKMRNDGSEVELVETEPSPPSNDIFHYDSAIRRIAHLYEARFPHA